MQSTVMTPSTISSPPQRLLQQPDGGFYRTHAAASSPPQQQQRQPQPPNAYVPTGGNNYYYGTQQQPVPPQQQYPKPPGSVAPTTTAGMHNSLHHNLGRISKIVLTKPADVPPLYTQIAVTEPMLIQPPSTLFIAANPYWSYQFTTILANGAGTWIVRRRFSHVLKLEDKLRQSCPGSILPPRPDKHATRALEEASMQQSAEFAIQRANELELYFSQLRQHPVAGQSETLRLFLGLQDDIGTAWPEVSSNAFTRLGAEVTGGLSKVTGGGSLTSGSAPAHEWEENAELLTLCSSENLRMGAVAQAVPKLEGFVSMLREQGDAAGAVGMELSKLTKQHPDDFKNSADLSNSLLKDGRRGKRLALELSAAMESFLQQYKLLRYEKMAMQDRRMAIQNKAKERRGADLRAMQLHQHQQLLQAQGRLGELGQLEQSAIQGDTFAQHAVHNSEVVGARLKSEIHRIAIQRRTEWNSSMKSIAKSMKEAYSERLVIWESILETLEPKEGAGEQDPPVPTSIVTNGAVDTATDTSTVYA